MPLAVLTSKEAADASRFGGLNTSSSSYSLTLFESRTFLKIGSYSGSRLKCLSKLLDLLWQLRLFTLS